MARAVLTGALVALGLAGAAAAQSAPAELRCRGGGAEGRAVVQTALSSPFYALIARRSGAPQTCTITARDGNIDARIGFADGSGMTIEASPEIGVAAYGLTLDAATPRPGNAEAVAALNRMQGWLLEDGGCGLSVAELRRGLTGPRATGEVSGDVCNCRAALTRDDRGIATLRFGSAC